MHRFPELDLDLTLTSEQEKIQWDGYGLTSDQQSMENAALVREILGGRFKSVPIPCFLDPSGHAQKWLLNYLTGRSVSFEVTTQADERFGYKLELAVRFGKTLVVADLEHFSASLLSVIVSDTHVRYNKRLLQVGGKLVDLHDDFKLVLVTSKSCLDSRVIRMDVAVRLTQIPFINTLSGYGDQLVATSICLKQPELAEKRIRLLQREGELLEERGRVQAKLLAELSTASGDLLRNESLIKSLSAAKGSSDEIDRSLNESKVVRARLAEDFAKYRKVCAKVAALFMGLAGTYRISVQTYTAEFVKVLQRQGDEEGGEGDERIFRRFIRQIYFSVARTIAKSEYTELALLICRSAYPEDVADRKWEAFITNFMGASGGAAAITSADEQSGRVPEWLRNKDTAAKVVSFAGQLPELYSVLNLADERLWQRFMTAEGNTSSSSSLDNNRSGSSSESLALQFPIQLPHEFDKVLIAQVLRPDLLLTVLQGFCSRQLGFNYMAVVQPTVQQLSAESSAEKPVILMLVNAGTDPSRELKELAGGHKGYVELSVSEGQERETLQCVNKAAKEGHWMCLKNVHLLPQLVRDLETELSTCLAAGVHPNFRLWIVCESLSGFSESFIIKSICVLLELPNGLKLKVQRLLRMWESSLVATVTQSGGGAGDGGRFLKLSFALFLFMGVLQERRQFIPQGFTKFYDFSDSDLRVAIDFVRLLMEQQHQPVAGKKGSAGGGAAAIEWNFVGKIIEIVAFGGRLSNEQDLKVLVAHVGNFFKASLFSPSWNVLPLLGDVVGTGGANSVPMSGRVSDYHEFLDRAFGEAGKDVDPQNFGLPKNVRALQNVQTCRQLLKQLRRENGKAENKNNNVDRQRLKPILSLWKNLSGVSGEGIGFNIECINLLVGWWWPRFLINQIFAVAENVWG